MPLASQYPAREGKDLVFLVRKVTEMGFASFSVFVDAASPRAAPVYV